MITTFFITGTGTEVGKTLITAGIAAAAIARGKSTAVIKPVQTGVPDYPRDIGTVAQLVPGLTSLPPEIACPYEFSLAASPHLAAETAGAVIEPEIIATAVAKAQKTPGLDILLIEGAGGLMVPLRNNYTNIDLIKTLNVPVVLTALAGLGTLNHTLLSMEALKNRKIPIAGIIINRMPSSPGPIEADNVKTIERLSGIRVIGVIPELELTPKKLSSAFLPALDKLLSTY